MTPVQADRFLPRLALWILPVTMAMGVLACLVTARVGYDVVDQTADDRSAFVVGDLSDAIQPSLNLGMVPADLSFVPDMLRRARDASPAVLSIDIYDRDRALVFSTDRSGISDTIPADWDAARRAASGRVWRAGRDDIGVVGAVLINGFDVPVGDVVLRYDRIEQGAGALDIAGLVGSGLIAGALGGLTLVALIGRVLRRERAAIAAAASALADRAPDRTLPDPGFGLAAGVAGFLAMSGRARELFETARGALKAIDDES